MRPAASAMDFLNNAPSELLCCPEPPHIAQGLVELSHGRFTKRNCWYLSMESMPKSQGTFEMKLVLRAGPNQMETLRRLRMAAEAIDKDVTVRSERIGQTRDFRVSLWFREKAMEQGFIASQHLDPSPSGASGDKTS